MAPPNVLISDAVSGYFLPVNQKGAFGVIEQINIGTKAFNIGNVIFYSPEDVAAISYNDTTIYRIVDENKIQFVESGPLPLP